MKKGESISMSVIIIAAIALLVLVVLAVLILRAGGSVGDGTACRGVGGSCKADCDPNYESLDITKEGRLGNCYDGEHCCVPITKTDRDLIDTY